MLIFFLFLSLVTLVFLPYSSLALSLLSPLSVASPRRCFSVRANWYYGAALSNERRCSSIHACIYARRTFALDVLAVP